MTLINRVRIVLNYSNYCYILLFTTNNVGGEL